MANQKVMDKKNDIVEEIKSRFNDNTTLVVFDYAGLTDKGTKEIKSLLREQGGDFKVYKNTLIKIATDDLGINIDEALVGPTAIAFGEDQLAPIKAIYKASKDNPNIVIKTGVINGDVQSQDTLKQLATIPSRETLLTMLAQGMMGIVRNLAMSLDMYAKQKEEENNG